jgi:hypothetical protein
LGVTRERSSLTALDDGAKTMTSFPERASIARTALSRKGCLAGAGRTLNRNRQIPRLQNLFKSRNLWRFNRRSHNRQQANEVDRL